MPERWVTQVVGDPGKLNQIAIDGLILKIWFGSVHLNRYRLCDLSDLQRMC